MSTNDNKHANVYDVIIIGAGLSGLSSAFYLKEKCDKLKILIVEGKDRCGGRTQTVELNTNRKGKKAKWDAGGQWVTDSQKNVTRLLEKLKIPTYPQHTNGKKILEINEKISTYKKSIPNISLLSLLDLNWLLTKFDMGAKRLNTIYPFENIHLATHLDSINLEQYMFSNSLSSTAQSIAEGAIKTIYGFESNQLNALFALMYGKSAGGFDRLALADKDCAQEKRIKGGAQQISEQMLDYVLESKDNQVLFNSALIEVHQNESNSDELASITIKNCLTEVKDEFYAKRIISSIPLNQYCYVKFLPELPSYKTSLFNQCKFGNYTKFIITYEKSFWREKGYSGEVLSDGSVLTVNEEKFNQIYQAQASNLTFNKQMPSIGPITCMFDATTNNDEPALIGFMACRSAIEWADQSAQIRRDEIIECLVRYFGEEAREYVDFFEKNWNQEPFTGGIFRRAFLLNYLFFVMLIY
jgi:monoamine oxidase